MGQKPFCQVVSLVNWRIWRLSLGKRLVVLNQNQLVWGYKSQVWFVTSAIIVIKILLSAKNPAWNHVTRSIIICSSAQTSGIQLDKHHTHYYLPTKAITLQSFLTQLLSNKEHITTIFPAENVYTLPTLLLNYGVKYNEKRNELQQHILDWYLAHILSGSPLLVITS